MIASIQDQILHSTIDHMKLLGPLSTVFFLPALLSAQGTTDIPDYRSKINKRVLEMRKKMREGRVREFNVHVRIRLKNNNKLKGVVKNGKFIEAHDGLDFVPANRNQAHAGLRLWFSAGTNSFIFVPYEAIAHYKIGRTLSDDQVKMIEKDLVTKHRAAQERYRKLVAQRRAAAKKAAGGQSDGKAADGKAGAVGAGLTLTKEQAALLAEFPAKGGWGEEKKKALKLRRITVGVFPNEKEQKFESVFDQWKVANDLRVKIEAARLAKNGSLGTKKQSGAADQGASGGATGGGTGAVRGTPSKGPMPTQPPKGPIPRPGR